MTPDDDGSAAVLATEGCDGGNGGGFVARADGGHGGGGRREATGEGGSQGVVTGAPSTPTVEDLLVAAERASEAAVGGRLSATSVLRTSVVEPSSGDSRIGASRPVPFEEGDFLTFAGARDILASLGPDSSIERMLRAEPEMGEGSRAEPEVEPDAAEVRVTAVEEVRAYLLEEQRAHLEGRRPEFTPAAYAPQLHFFEPTGMDSYVPARTEYPEEMVLRDRSSHISSGWAQVTSNDFNC
jgi:hypothetical protein